MAKDKPIKDENLKLNADIVNNLANLKLYITR